MFGSKSRPLIAVAFQPIDVQAVARRLKLTARGREDGAKGIPSSSSDQLSQSELEILGDVTAHRAHALESLAGHLRAVNDRLAQLSTQMDIAKMRQDTARTITEFESIHHDVETDLAEKNGRIKHQRREYDDFCQKNGLHRPARLSTGGLWKVALILFALILETMLNGLLFAAGSNNGILGGFAIAAALSFINIVMFGMLEGRVFLRYAMHARLWLRVPAILLVIITAFCMVAFNLFVAHFRDSAAAIAADSLPDPGPVIAHVLAAPLHLASIESILLLCLGVFCGCLGALDFLSFGDPYPGYGAMDQRLQAALSDYADTRRDLLDNAKDARDTLLKELEAAMQALRGAAAQRSQALDTRHRFIAAYEAHERDLEQATNQLLAIYRAENAVSRKSPRPPTFDSSFVFPEHGLDHTTIRALMVEPPAPPDAEALVKELTNLRDSALDEFRRTLGALPAEHA